MAVKLVPAVRKSLDAADWIKGDQKYEAFSAYSHDGLDQERIMPFPTAVKAHMSQDGYEVWASGIASALLGNVPRLLF